MKKLTTAYRLLEKLGPRIIRLRAGVYVRNALGLTRRKFTPRAWSSIGLGKICSPGTPVDPTAYAEYKRRGIPKFLFPLGQPPAVPEVIRRAAAQRQPPLTERLRLIEENRCVYCFRTVSPTPIDWNANPLDGTRFENAERTWSDIPDVATDHGDLRLFWEPSRAAWAIDLARAKSHGLQVHAGALYWRWFDSWMNACPPWRGPNWKCGQEATIRLAALSLGFWAIASEPETTPARWVQFARMAWATGHRIEQHLQYARSQKNNHALSEACGLMLIGHLFPEFRQAAGWFAQGRKVFCDELARQVYADGSYVQHSHNYHRVMLQTAVLAARLAQWHNQPFDSATMERIASAEEFLYQMLDETTGQVPLYGNNDGAWVLPLDECDFTDYRGAVQAAHYLTHGKRRLPQGPWDEDLLWLFGPEAVNAPQESQQPPQSTAFDDGGYYTLRSTESWGMVRCHTYRDRPSHYDQLHFDLWYRGHNLLCDSGTYKYNPQEGKPLEDYFQLISGHNTIELDGHSPVERVSRFLFFPWPRAKVRHFEAGTNGHRYFEGERYDYDVRPWQVLHRRAIVGFSDDLWLIIDDLLGAGRHAATLRWHLADMPTQLDRASSTITAETASGECFFTIAADIKHPWDRLQIVRGQLTEQGAQGFAAPYYGERLPIPTVEAEVAADLPLRLVTLVAPHAAAKWELRQNTSQGETFELNWKDRSWHIDLGPRSRSADRVVKHIAANTAGRTSAAAAAPAHS